MRLSQGSPTAVVFVFHRVGLEGTLQRGLHDHAGDEMPNSTARYPWPLDSGAS